jgi:hypothetical protein
MLPLLVNGIVFHHPEANEGFISIQLEGATVSVKAHWPFDRSTDDWIEVENRFSSGAYKRCVQTLMASGSAVVDGLEGGFLRLERRDGEGLWLDLCGSRGWRPQQLSLTIPDGLRKLTSKE